MPRPAPRVAPATTATLPASGPDDDTRLGGDVRVADGRPDDDDRRGGMTGSSREPANNKRPFIYFVKGGMDGAERDPGSGSRSPDPGSRLSTVFRARERLRPAARAPHGPRCESA